MNNNFIYLTIWILFNVGLLFEMYRYHQFWMDEITKKYNCPPEQKTSSVSRVRKNLFLAVVFLGVSYYVPFHYNMGHWFLMYVIVHAVIALVLHMLPILQEQKSDETPLKGVQGTSLSAS